MLSLNYDANFDSNNISSGDVLCDLKNPIKYAGKMECVIKLFDIPSKIFKGH